MRRFLVVVLTWGGVGLSVPTALHASSRSGPVDRPASATVAADRTGTVAQVDPPTVPSPPTAPPPVEPPPPPSPPPSPPSPGLDPQLVEVLRLVNEERTAQGLAPLASNPLLHQAAQAHSEDQARRNVLTHYSEDGSGPGDRISRTGYRFSTWGENAASGYGSAAAVMSGWLNSPGHRRNLLNPDFTEIGLGLAYTSSGRPYWTQDFARPLT